MRHLVPRKEWGQPGVTLCSQDHRRDVSRQPRTPGDMSAAPHETGQAKLGTLGTAALTQLHRDLQERCPSEAKRCRHSRTSASLLGPGIAASQTRTSSAVAAEMDHVSVTLHSDLCCSISGHEAGPPPVVDEGLGDIPTMPQAHTC